MGFKVLLANCIGSCFSDIQAVGFESISAPVAWMGYSPTVSSCILTLRLFHDGSRPGKNDGIHNTCQF